MHFFPPRLIKDVAERGSELSVRAAPKAQPDPLPGPTADGGEPKLRAATVATCWRVRRPSLSLCPCCCGVCVPGIVYWKCACWNSGRELGLEPSVVWNGAVNVSGNGACVGMVPLLLDLCLCDWKWCLSVLKWCLFCWN